MPTYAEVILSPESNPVFRETVKIDGRRIVVVRGGSRLSVSAVKQLLLADHSTRHTLRAILEEDGTTHWYSPAKIFALLGFCCDCLEIKSPCDHCGGPHRCKQTSPTTPQ